MNNKVLNGIFVINKHEGVTSRYIDNFVQRRFNVKKVGHLGTLDPLASGLLVIALNEATKTLQFYEDAPKEYIATFKFGLLTSTLDLEGEVLEENDIAQISNDKLSAVLQRFIGETVQTPPMTSALKVDGKRLYEYARENKSVKIKERTVTVHTLELLDFSFPYFTIKTKVSKGTYIRTLGNDIAAKLGTVATTVKLQRTAVGTITLHEAVTIAELALVHLQPTDYLLKQLPRINVGVHEAIDIKNGKVLKHAFVGTFVTIYTDEKLLAVYVWKDTHYAAKRGFNL